MTDLPPDPDRYPDPRQTPPGGSLQTMLGPILPGRSRGLKLLLVCGLALIMAIPALFVYGIVLERSDGASSAVREISEKVGGQQSLLGPVLALPYSHAPDPQKPDNVVYGVAVAYAETGLATAYVAVEERQRGIHLIPVFKSEVDFKARFNPESLRSAVPQNATPIWTDARLYVGLSDSRGISDQITVTANGSPVLLEPFANFSGETNDYRITPPSNSKLAGGTIRNLENIRTPFDVYAKMIITGAERFAIGPFARDTRVKMTSNWATPSFTGGTLPTGHDVGVSDDGFTAEWHVPYLARGIAGAGPRLNLGNVTQYEYRDMAVRFIHAANPYQSVQRALKYAAMFVGLVFLSYFLFEVTSGLRAHPAQYILVGLAQTIFYLLLLAFSERIGFDAAFLISAGMTVCLTAAYAMSVFKSRKYGLRAFAILSGIYTLIYVLMRAEGEALLAGAVASFTAIAVTMWLTRNVDWYGDEAPATA